MDRFRLKKEERLCSHNVIGNLFSDGRSFFIFPLKVVYLELTEPSSFPVQAAFSVSRRNFKRAVKRNLLKRLMRESYRLNKNVLYDTIRNGKSLAVMFIYAGKEIKDYKVVESAMKQALYKLLEVVRE